MSNTKDNNRQVTDNIRKKGATNPITRRRIVIGGSTLAAGLTTVGIVKPDRVSLQQPQEKVPLAPTMAGQLKGKVAFITGAARGIGRATALTLAREGADIVAFDIASDISTVPYKLASENDLRRIGEDVRALERKCLTIKGDVRDMAALRRAFARAVEELGGVDIVVANAGIDSAAPLSEMSDAAWNDIITVNLTGVANTFRAAIPHVVKRSIGRLVAISSEGGRRGSPGRSNYCAAKWGIIGLVKSVAQELGPQGVTVNAICPGSVRTGMTQNAAIYKEILPNVKNPPPKQIETALREGSIQAGKLPLAFMEPEEIANGILFLCSDQGRYVTGTALDITAGTSASYTT